MARELVISLYLFVFHTIFTIFKLFPQKKKTTYVASFGENILCTINELEKQTDEQIVVLKTSHCKTDFGAERLTLNFETGNPINWLRSVYHIATSDKVIVDNYYGFLSATAFKSNVQCIQLWHAAGAIKQFGLKDPAIQGRSERAYNRFNKVYRQFDHVVVGSERMASIFKESFNLHDVNILRTGVPRTDFFFDESAKETAKQSLLEEYPILNGKKVILYAPTYRDDALDSAKLELNLEKMFNQLKGQYILLLRLHPAVNDEFQNKYPGFVFNVSSYDNINPLLVVTDILITDYSSIPFEFSLLNKPMVFYAYDLEQYSLSRGFWESYEDLVPGPVVETTHDLIDVIKNGHFDIERIETFATHWNQYSQGASSEQLIKAIYTEDEHYESVNESVKS